MHRVAIRVLHLSCSTPQHASAPKPASPAISRKLTAAMDREYQILLHQKNAGEWYHVRTGGQLVC